MTKKQLTAEEIKRKLHAQNFGQDNGLLEIQPGSLVNLTIDKILPYDKNPRKGKNPRFELIKDSIKQRGVEQTVSVTQRPGMDSDVFMIASGGNTRLEALKELYEETGDNKFFHLQCKYIPWSSESDALISHLIENDARGDYRYIDRILAVVEASNLFEQELQKNLSSSETLKMLNDNGYKISNTHYHRISYANDNLISHLKIAFENGLNSNQTDRLEKLHKASKQIFDRTDSDNNAEEFDELFHQILKQADSDNLDNIYDDVFDLVGKEIAYGDAMDTQTAKYRIRMLIEGTSIDDLFIEDRDDDKADVEIIETVSADDEDDVSGDNTQNVPIAPTIKKTPKQIIYKLAKKIAGRYGIENLIADVSNHPKGVGYFVQDFPNWSKEDLEQNITGEGMHDFETKSVFFTELFWTLVSISCVYSRVHGDMVPDEFHPKTSLLSRVHGTATQEDIENFQNLTYMVMSDTRSDRQLIFYRLLPDDCYEWLIEINQKCRNLTRNIDIWGKD